jgi:hypothetical protein
MMGLGIEHLNPARCKPVIIAAAHEYVLGGIAKN